MVTLGERLRSRRWDELRFFQKDVAAAAGLSTSRLSELERDRHRVTEPTLWRLATVLALDPDELVAQAVREDRLARQSPSRGRRDRDGVGPPPVPVPPVPPHPVPDKPWLTTAEAADALGLTAFTVGQLIRRGRLAPARKARGGKGPPRWLVAAEAVVAHEPSGGWERPKPGPHLVPTGYLSLAAFAEAVGLSYGALHRRLEAGEISSVRVGWRRLIPTQELPRYLDERRD